MASAFVGSRVVTSEWNDCLLLHAATSMPLPEPDCDLFSRQNANDSDLFRSPCHMHVQQAGISRKSQNNKPRRCEMSPRRRFAVCGFNKHSRHKENVLPCITDVLIARKLFFSQFDAAE